MSTELTWNEYPRKKPKCDMTPDSLGVNVLVWIEEEFTRDKGYAMACYYGMRIGNTPMFYKYGTEVRSVVGWMYLPKGPRP